MGKRESSQVVGLTAFPLPEMGASASRNGRTARGSCTASVHNFIRNPTSRLLSLRHTPGPVLFLPLRRRLRVCIWNPLLASSIATGPLDIGSQ